MDGGGRPCREQAVESNAGSGCRGLGGTKDFCKPGEDRKRGTLQITACSWRVTPGPRILGILTNVRSCLPFRDWQASDLEAVEAAHDTVALVAFAKGESAEEQRNERGGDAPCAQPGLTEIRNLRLQRFVLLAQ